MVNLTLKFQIMYIDEAEKLRKEWGDKPCNHPHIEREYYRATKETGNVPTKTGDWVCTQCGKDDFTEKEKKAIDEARKNH